MACLDHLGEFAPAMKELCESRSERGKRIAIVAVRAEHAGLRVEIDPIFKFDLVRLDDVTSHDFPSVPAALDAGLCEDLPRRVELDEHQAEVAGLGLDELERGEIRRHLATVSGSTLLARGRRTDWLGVQTTSGVHLGDHAVHQLGRFDGAGMRAPFEYPGHHWCDAGAGETKADATVG